MMAILIWLLWVVLSILYPGWINRTKSILTGRKGPSIFQPAQDLWKLFKKDSLHSETSSFLFRIAPAINFASVLVALMMIPFGSDRGLISFSGDFIFFVFLLATGRFFLLLAALDTGSSFEAMGASREALFSLLADPAFFVLLGTLALMTGHTSFANIFTFLHQGATHYPVLSLLMVLVLVQISLIDNSRMPVDDPKTHLELTMVREVMILDHSGFDLGLLLGSTYL
ncbi:MAG: respiratory chain complex I subunit 1 family protein, partial [Chitinophagaceae bacterium]